jgi:hypothetical protein
MCDDKYTPIDGKMVIRNVGGLSGLSNLCYSNNTVDEKRKIVCEFISTMNLDFCGAPLIAKRDVLFGDIDRLHVEMVTYASKHLSGVEYHKFVSEIKDLRDTMKGTINNQVVVLDGTRGLLSCYLLDLNNDSNSKYILIRPVQQLALIKVSEGVFKERDMGVD